MKSLFTLKYFLLLFSAGLMLMFQNCSAGGGFMALEVVDMSSLASAEFNASKTILAKNCASCHQSGGTSATRLDFTSEREFLASGLIEPGEPDKSKLILRLSNFTGASAANLQRNMPPGGSLSDKDYQTLRRWITQAKSGDNAEVFQCDANAAVDQKLLPDVISVLTDRQYLNTVRDLAQAWLPAEANSIYQTSVNGVIFPTNTARYERSVSDLTAERLSAFFKIADKFSSLVSDPSRVNNFAREVVNYKPGFCSYSAVNTMSTECQKQLIRNLGLFIYRRPLIENTSVNEVALFASEFGSADVNTAIGNTVFRMMMSQNFLFKMEDQEIEINSPDVVKLSSYSLINRMSYSFWNTLPDKYLFSLAESGITDDSRFLTALDYVLENNKVEDGLKDFAQQWFMLKKMSSFDANSIGVQNYSEGIPFDNQMKQAMAGEVQDFMSHIVRSGGSFSDLFTSDVSTVRDANLMKVYGLTTAAPAVITSSNAVRMPSGTRSGILTRAALLAEANGKQHLIHRAVRIKRDIMCVTTPPAPADITTPVPMTEDEILKSTTRQKIAHDTGSGVCFSCHQTINPYGFALSNYNGLGFYKQQEPATNRGGALTGVMLAIDSTTDFTGVLSGAAQLRDAKEFSSFVGQRMETQACFVKNYATFFLNRDVNTDQEGCRLNKMLKFTSKTGTIKDAIRSIATDPEFRFRKIKQ